jgi:DNA-binding NtrC family response regulator
MTSEPEFELTILVIDDEEPQLRLVREVLEQDGLRIITSAGAVEGLELFQKESPGLALVDLMMPGMDGIKVLEQMLAHDPTAEVILMTGHYTPESAVEAIRKGASDYIAKPLNIQALRKRVRAIASESKRRLRAIQLDHELVETWQFEGIVGRSPAMLEVFAKIRRAAPHFQTALITGATGTGKERVAQALHSKSPVAKKTFAVCNCSALPETLYESELFGYVRGAFTGALQDKAGLFEYANGGTMFLDEIGDMPLSGQAKLLRVLQNREIQRVGSPVPRRIDVRVIAATNQDLRTLVAEKKFREDLFYRLSMIEIQLPPLANRKEDLPLLQRHFIEKASIQYQKPVRRLTSRAQMFLSSYSWPGNVRELENVIGNACMMSEGDVVDIADLPAYLLQPAPPPRLVEGEKILTLEEVQRRYVIDTLKRFGGNKVRAAEVLGIGKSTIYNILQKVGSENLH